jgi:hypothetical protein
MLPAAADWRVSFPVTLIFLLGYLVDPKRRELGRE